MAYTKRTCHNCGYRDIQPNMRQVEIKYKSGSSSAGLSNRAVISSIFGSDSGAKQVQNWATGKSKRNYHRTRKVWECAGGCGKQRITSTSTNHKAPKLTKEEKQLAALEKQLNAEERLAIANAKLAALKVETDLMKAEEYANMSTWGKVAYGAIESLKQLLYSLLWGAVIFTGVFIMYTALS